MSNREIIEWLKKKAEACPAHEWCDRYEDTMEGTNE